MQINKERLHSSLVDIRKGDISFSLLNRPTGVAGNCEILAIPLRILRVLRYFLLSPAVSMNSALAIPSVVFQSKLVINRVPRGRIFLVNHIFTRTVTQKPVILEVFTFVLCQFRVILVCVFGFRLFCILFLSMHTGNYQHTRHHKTGNQTRTKEV